MIHVRHLYAAPVPARHAPDGLVTLKTLQEAAPGSSHSRGSVEQGAENAAKGGWDVFCAVADRMARERETDEDKAGQADDRAETGRAIGGPSVQKGRDGQNGKDDAQDKRKVVRVDHQIISRCTDKGELAKCKRPARVARAFAGYSGSTR